MMNRESKTQRSFFWQVFRTVRWSVIVLLVGVGVVRMSGCAERLAYFPSPQAFVTPEGYEDVWFETADGLKLHGWFMPAKGIGVDGVAPAILHVHGNAGNVSSHESFSRFLTYEGFHVLVFDYRGYGRSDDRGGLNRDRLVVDTQAALDALLARPDVDPERVGVLGVSLGGAFGLRVAADDSRVGAVATVSAFSSWQGIASDAVPVLGGLLFRSGVDGVDSVAELGDTPLLVMHGLEDGVVDPRHAGLLVDSAKEHGIDVELLTIADGDHNSLLQRSGDARKSLVRFYRQHLSIASSIEDGEAMVFQVSSKEVEFWKWFFKNSDKLLVMPGREFIDAVGQQIQRVDSGIVIEIGPAGQRPRELIVSADGIASLVDVVNILCDAAPASSHWTVTRFRPRKKSFESIGFRYDQLEIDPERVRYIAIPNESRVDVIIYAHWRSDPEDYNPDGPSFILLDMTIGELDVIERIGEINVLPLESAPSHALAWSEFRDSIDEFKALDD